MFRSLWRALIVIPLLAAAPAHAAGDMLSLELNTAESADNRCRLTFVIENKTEASIDSIKLDLVVFNPEGIVQRRVIIEMGPVRAKKTNVRIFPAEGDCSQIGAILVNDVTACAPGDVAACLDGLSLTSRMKAVRLYK
jgi:hypothetical protein